MQGAFLFYIIFILLIVSWMVFAWVMITAHHKQRISRQELTKIRGRERLERDRVITLVNNLTDAIFSIDQHGIIGLYNAAALNLVDTNTSIQGVHIDELLNLEATDGRAIPVFKELQKASSIRTRDDIIMPLGGNDRMRLSATFAPIQGDAGMTSDGYVLILRDITRVKSLEEERDEFISVVSHELRTPITIAEASLSNFRAMKDRGMIDKLDDTLTEAHKQVLFLARIVNDLSALSRAERGVADSAEIIDVTELAHKLCREYEPHATEKGLAFNLDVRAGVGKVNVLRLYLEELLQNFITNAIKYTQKGSITLIMRRTGGQVYFGVKDTGIGIGRSDQKHVFDRFFRAEDYRTRETSGTGLGLYVASKLARKLNCTITLESRLNHGSTFSFKLPPVKKK